MPFHIVVCAGLVPDPLQSLEPVMGPSGPGLKNEAMLPAVIDPWAAHALFEAAHLAKTQAGSRLWLVSLAPKAKLQQVLMIVAQKAPFELVAIDGPANGFTDASSCAVALADAIAAIPGLDRERLLLFGGWESASRASGTTLQMVGERLGITEQFQGVDALAVGPDGRLEILERIEGGRHQMATCTGAPAVLGWATGSLHEPPNNPQLGMTNMRSLMPALQKARAAASSNGIAFAAVTVPSGLKAGFSEGILSGRALRGSSSVSRTPALVSMTAISRLKRPSVVALCARRRVSSA
jgi:electron transfer flavoprotein beta subunit